MFMVYWTAGNEAPEAMCAQFGSDQMLDAMKLMEELRSNPTNHFICMASENPNSVGKQGVAAPSADYNWTKRRHNERDPSAAVTRRNYNATDEVEVPIDEE